MSRNMNVKQKKKSSAKKNALIALGVVLLLFALFALSFFVTSFVLQMNQAPDLSGVVAEPTPKPTYEELEKMVIEKDERIKELEERLETYRGAAGNRVTESTQAPSKAPTSSPSQAPTKAPTQAPTKAPTKAPTVAPTAAPTQAPVASTAPSAGTAE